MFEFEIIDLLKKLKTSRDEYEIKKIKKSISNLIKENPQKYENFLQMQALDDQTLKLFKECEKIEEEQDQNKTNETSDFEIIKNNYEKWLIIYNQNNNIPNEQNEKIIYEIISFYIQNRFEVLEKILKIKDDENYEAFKNMLKNYLRKYFAEKINNYYNSEEYKKLGFFKQRKKNKNLLHILDEIGKYNFNKKEIEEALK